MEHMKKMLLVEDNEDDIDLTLLCLKKNHIINPVDVSTATALKRWIICSREGATKTAT